MFQKSPLELASWPAWILDLLDAFLAREPAPGDRVEIGIARLASMWSGDPDSEVVDFLPFLNAWREDQPGRYSAADLKVIKALK